MLSSLFEDRIFFATLLRIAVPIALQQLVFAGLSAVDSVLIGQLGETSVAAVGLANQVSFLLALSLFGIGSGCAIFGAQFWGRRDVRNIGKVLGIGLLMGIAIGILFTVIAVFTPELALGAYSRDPAVVALGSRYLRIVGLSYVVTSITAIYSYLLRSTENVRLPMGVSIFALSLKTGLSYALIFGRFGFPALGVDGAAIATCLARYLECMILLALTYARRLPIAAQPREMVGFSAAFLTRVILTTMPVVVGEILWSLGITIYNVVYARIGTESIAAFNIASTIEGLAFVVFIGLCNACAIMIGHRIGAGEEGKASLYARRFLILDVIGAVMMSLLLLIGAPVILSLYKISPETEYFARRVLVVIAAGLLVKGLNMVAIVGILRGGGDTRFAFYVDVGSVWLVGIPVALFGAFVLHLPVFWVVALVLSDELVKCVISLWRVFSNRWIHNVVQQI